MSVKKIPWEDIAVAVGAMLIMAYSQRIGSSIHFADRVTRFRLWLDQFTSPDYEPDAIFLRDLYDSTR